MCQRVGDAARGLPLAAYDGDVAIVVALLRQQPVMLIGRFTRVNEIVVLNLICEFGFVRLTGDVADGREQDR